MKRMCCGSVAAGVLSLALGLASAGAETVVSDRAAALAVFPLVLSSPNTLIDTTIQLSNTSPDPVAVRCYYVNTIGECSATGDPCLATEDCRELLDLCVPKWVETDFDVYLTARQPLAWLASEGLHVQDLPLDGILRSGPNRQSNAGTRVPPFGDEGLGYGELKCYAVEHDGTPSERNVLIGNATLSSQPAIHQSFDEAKYSAVGFRAISGTNNHDNRLTLGGDGAEYDGCPGVLILNHFFDFATDPISGEEITSSLILAPCTENFVNQVPTLVTAQYLVFNEFEQRFSTSQPVDCYFVSGLSSIDTRSKIRSIFGVFVAGTLTGQTRIRGVNGGIIGVAVERHGQRLAEFDMHHQGEREGGSDVLTVVQ